MSYKIAVATSDGVNVDLHFGSTNVFSIYKAEGENFDFLESRRVINSDNDPKKGCNCGEGGGCGNGSSNTCGGGEKSEAVELLSDCRAVVCAKIGRNILKQLELRAISTFDVSIPVNEALEKIVTYYNKVDNRLYGAKNK
ncbi:MAG: hypothetical protein IKR94_10370 [Bacteroidales bacterium]|nr:hypothetical protein [Bacteroidales bacterium]